MRINVIFLCIFFVGIFAENTQQMSSEEKEDVFENKVEEFNSQFDNLRLALKQEYEWAMTLVNSKADEKDIQNTHQKIREIKLQLKKLHEKWKLMHKEQEKQDESYAFWDQGETTLAQLVMEYGAVDYLYVIPYELGAMKLQLFSGIPIPHESWEEMLELILSYNGIGIKKINTFMKQLFILKHNPGHVDAIVDSVEELSLLPPTSIVFYVFSPPLEHLKVAQSFFERFSDLNQTTVQLVGSKVIIISSKDAVQRLLDIYEAVWKEKSGKIIRVINLHKIRVQHAEQVLNAFFQDNAGKVRPSFYQLPKDELIVLPQDNSLVLIGALPLIENAEKIIEDLEQQAQDPEEMMIFWYNCQYSDPEDVAAVLDKVYSSLGQLDMHTKMPLQAKAITAHAEKKETNTLPVSPTKVEPEGLHRNKVTKSCRNFFVDPKTGSIFMVIKKEDLEKIKKLLKKLDVPKKMVQIDVLLVERKVHDQKQCGMNLLKIGNVSSSSEEVVVNTNFSSQGKGILDFILKTPPHKHFPSIDMTLGFLLSQNDLQIKANPSVLAINQTEAKISIVEEMSINTGAVPIETAQGTTYQQSFTRAQFGIVIAMTPTIHMPDENNDEEKNKGSITLLTNVTFDTTQKSHNERPPVTRRNVKNEVRVADGETIILGGLRKRSIDEETEKIPFLGDIPGIGKLFGSSSLSDQSTEMFIFITPRIIEEPIDQFRKRREADMQLRPGDNPLLFEKIKESKDEEKKRLFTDSLNLIFEKNR